MATAAPSLIRSRLAVLGAIIFAYFASLLPLLLMGREGLLLAAVVGFIGLQLLAIAAILGTWAAPHVIERPWKWAFAAGFGGILLGGLGMALDGGALYSATLGLPVAVLAPLLFRPILKVLLP